MHDALKKLPPMTVAEFLEWPGDGTGRTYQLANGEVQPVSPASAAHGTIQMTLGSLIWNALDASGSPCRVVCEPGIYTPVRPHLNMRVPDLGISCTPDAPGQRALPDPVVLIEILSPSNPKDTWGNVWAYTTIPSMQEIVVVHSTRVLAEQLRRGADGRWPERPAPVEPDGTLRLSAIAFACRLREVYARTHLA